MEGRQVSGVGVDTTSPAALAASAFVVVTPYHRIQPVVDGIDARQARFQYFERADLSCPYGAAVALAVWKCRIRLAQRAR